MAEQFAAPPINPIVSIRPLTTPSSGRDATAVPAQLANLPPGCSFAPRCAEAIEQCRTIVPEAVSIDRGHFACCIRAAATATAEPARAIA